MLVSVWIMNLLILVSARQKTMDMIMMKNLYVVKKKRFCLIPNVHNLLMCTFFLFYHIPISFIIILTPFYSLDYFSNIFLSNFSCVPSYQCLGGGESVDLRQEATTCGFFIRQDKGNVDLRAEEVDLRSTKINLRQSRKRVSLRQDSEYYDDYYEYDEDSNLICCNQENYIKPVDDCSDQEDHVYV